jgi:hypothetical protein
LIRARGAYARAGTLRRGGRGNRERGDNRYAAQEMLHVIDPLLQFRTSDQATEHSKTRRRAFAAQTAQRFIPFRSGG